MRFDPGFRLELVYVGSAGGEGEYPRWDHPEVAIAGRSNSGKSSLLNSLGGSRKLARVSRTPGRTQRLHFFLERRLRLALVDLPGWGFARASRASRAEWGELTERYLETRPNLRAVLVLVDVRRDPGDDEALLGQFAAGRGLRLVRLATKVDKLGRSEREARLRALGQGGVEWIPFSAKTGEGRRELAAVLSDMAT